MFFTPFILFFFFFSRYNFHLWMFWPSEHIISNLLWSRLQLVQFFIFSFFISFLMSSYHLFFGLPSGLLNIGFHLYTFFTILSSGIRCKWPNQLNLHTIHSPPLNISSQQHSPWHPYQQHTVMTFIISVTHRPSPWTSTCPHHAYLNCTPI
jgi:hypothetical protein